MKNMNLLHIAKYCREGRRCARCGGGGIVGQGGEAVRPKCCKLWRSNSVAFREGNRDIRRVC